MADDQQGRLYEKAEAVDVLVSELKPNEYNPNRQTETEFELLCRSMEEHGFTQPILVQAGTNIIVDGEHRWRAASYLGYEKIPVVYREYTPVEMRIATLGHNRARGTEDIRIAGDVYRQLAELGAEDWVKDSLVLDDIEFDLLTMPTIDIAPPPTNPADYNALEQRRREEREQEKAMAAQDMAGRPTLYTLNLVYTWDESEVIRQMLEPNVATAILEICKAELQEAA